MAEVYVDTSFVSACVTERGDPASVYRRNTSLQWWTSQAQQHYVYISPEVIAELSHPLFPQRRKALSLVEGLPLLEVDDEVQGLALVFIREKLMPSPVAGDAIHVAVACVHGLDFLLTWNVRHLANPNKLQHLQTVCLRVGYVPPRILTPDLLWEESDD